ncbi:MAG: orotidine-5'-phosphate decarboxylase [Psychroflexus sp.]|nr:orotidine-5'-phosphate decarboxylase [Psychroflexus sp.]MDR9448255.1 orotidine-5'-phosphate decarboxylase [Psychroflexus sp.]
METKFLVDQIKKKRSFLSIGLDTDIDKIPKHLLDTEDPIFRFNQQIIDETHDLAISYKINTAFYEVYGWKGWQSMQKTFDYIKTNYPEQFLIADAKRGDIGNTSLKYAAAFFDDLQADAITVAPYMGEDSVSPFLSYQNKHVILLALTSNSGAADLQLLKVDDKPLYEQVINKSLQWTNSQNLMYVIGATQPEHFKRIRALAPHHFFLVPGIGAQGGDLDAVCRNGMNDDIGLIINSSRGIIYASAGNDFAKAARESAKAIQAKMALYLSTC